MKTQTLSDKSLEFYFPDVDTSLLVEHSGDQVVFRATKNTFTLQRKLHFIHQLATEGFIPDHYQWLSDMDSEGSNVRWRVDYSWLKIHGTNVLKTRKFMIGLLASAVLAWLGMMLALVRGWL